MLGAAVRFAHPCIKSLPILVVRTLKEKCPWKKEALWMVSHCEWRNELSCCPQYGDTQERQR